jgi:7-carboxy-7-deazaguanine synthase
MGRPEPVGPGCPPDRTIATGTTPLNADRSLRRVRTGPGGDPRSDIVASLRLRPLEGKPDGSLVIHEIYRSLQGESTFAGLPCVFVRLTACHLRCGYCDTTHAFQQGQVLPLDEVVARALALGDLLVEVTGGEPLLQPEVLPLLARLADAGRTVLLETSGALDIGPVDPRVRIILDLKTPGSGEAAANRWENLPRLKPTDEVKVVVCDRADFDWAVAQIRAHHLLRRCPVLLGAVYGRVDPAELASWILETGLPLRLQVQLHKILWDPAARGV